MMSLNIKNEAAHRLAKELATLTGESMSAAVTRAIDERLRRLRRDNKAKRIERMMAIARDAGDRWKEPWKSMDHADLLYDEKGLPK